jgi:heterodisulfide reductase subunit A2
MLWDARGMGIGFDVYDPLTGRSGWRTAKWSSTRRYSAKQRAPCDLVVLVHAPCCRARTSADVAGTDAGADRQKRLLPGGACQTATARFCRRRHLCLRQRPLSGTSVEARTQGIGVASTGRRDSYSRTNWSKAPSSPRSTRILCRLHGLSQRLPLRGDQVQSANGSAKSKEILCKGCGNCASTCPSHSAILRGYKPEQLLAQIRAIVVTWRRRR